MQFVKSIALSIPECTMSYNSILARGLKNLPPLKPAREIEYPEKTRLRMVPKTPQYPAGTRIFKMQKRLKLLRGPEEIHNTLQHKQFGVMAVQGGRMLFKHFEYLRVMFQRQRYKNNIFVMYRVDPPWQPLTKQGQGQRMGGGKPGVSHYATPVKPGRIILEVGGDCEFFEVEKGLNAAAHSLPFKAIAVSQEMLDAKEKKEKELDDKNLHPFTWKYMIQNNLAGCHNWIGPYDKLWFNKYQ